MSEAKTYLLTGAAPTPNGRLHLGHIGAQFLKLDVLKRHTVRSGGRAVLAFSVDAFDNPVTFTAREAGESEAEICRRYYDGIVRDLDDVAIDYDVFLDTSTGPGRELIHRTAVDLDEVLAARKVPVAEKIAYSRRTGAPVTGRFLAGECPACGRTIHGYSCDPCGLYLSADHIANARAVDPTDALDWREVTNYFVRTDAAVVRGYVDSRTLPARIRAMAAEIAADMLAGDDVLARWTASEPWGIGTGIPGQVFFNRMLITLGEQVAFGELARARLGLDRNPFEAGSGVDTVLAYGADNLGGFLIENSALALATERYRPFDHHLVSEFYLLRGEKMSTSRPHATWVAEVADLEGFSRDGLRAYMASIATPEVEVDVSPSTLHRGMRSFAERTRAVLAACSAAGRPARIDRDVLGRARRSLERQTAALDLARIDLPAYWRVTDDWVDLALSGDIRDHAGTLACLAVVVTPLLPDLAAAAWRRLGLPGEPNPTALTTLAADAA